MAEQSRKQSKPRKTESDIDEIGTATSAEAEELTERIDDLLEEIDSVLEENAEEFVKNYVQKGGE